MQITEKKRLVASEVLQILHIIRPQVLDALLLLKAIMPANEQSVSESCFVSKQTTPVSLRTPPALSMRQLIRGTREEPLGAPLLSEDVLSRMEAGGGPVLATS